MINLVSTCKTSLGKYSVSLDGLHVWTLDSGILGLRLYCVFRLIVTGSHSKHFDASVLQFKNEKCLGLAKKNASVAQAQSLACHSPSLSAGGNLCKGASTCSWAVQI